jgi:ABC-type Fe3+-siderophore transport system permease subunit
MLLELLLLGLIVFVIGPIVYVGFMGVSLSFLLTHDSHSWSGTYS